MINVHWLDADENILQLDYIAPVLSWAEYDDAIERCCNMASQCSGNVYIIHNAGTTPMPEGNAIQHIRRAVRQTPPNVKMVVMVVTNLFALRLLELVMKLLFSRMMRMTKSLDGAYALIGLHSLTHEGRLSAGMP